MFVAGAWCIYLGDVGVGLAYLGIGAVCLAEVNDQDEIEYLHRELKRLREANNSIDEVI